MSPPRSRHDRGSRSSLPRLRPCPDSPLAGKGTGSRAGGREIAFADARVMHGAAMARLEAGDIRNAAEKAWCATKRAADGVIIARTGETPQKSPETTRMLRQLAVQDDGVRQLTYGYYAARDVLHGDCFYSGLCDPLEDTLRLIRETTDYIAEAERLAAL